MRKLSGREICKVLSRHGFVEVRQKGSHVVMQNDHRQFDGIRPCPTAFGGEDRHASIYHSAIGTGTVRVRELTRATAITATILFFGATADEIGFRTKTIDASPEARVSDLVETLIMDHPALRRHTLLFSVNQEYVPDDVILKDGDEIAIFTAVSGG